MTNDKRRVMSVDTTTMWSKRQDDSAWWREERGVQLCVREPTRKIPWYHSTVDAIEYGRDAPRLDGDVDTLADAKYWCDHWARVVLRWIDEGRKVEP